MLKDGTLNSIHAILQSHGVVLFAAELDIPDRTTLLSSYIALAPIIHVLGPMLRRARHLQAPAGCRLVLADLSQQITSGRSSSPRYSLWTPYLPSHPARQARAIATARSSVPAPSSGHRLRDEKIQASFVILKREDGALEERTLLRRMLERYDHKTHTLVQLAPASDNLPPICSLMTHTEYYNQLVKPPKKEKNHGSVLKKLEITWQIDQHDLGLRLDKLQEFLGEGYRVEITLANKRRTKPVGPQRARGIVAAVKQRIADIEGARESKESIGQLGRMMTFSVEGKRIVTEVAKPEKRERRIPKPPKELSEMLSDEQLAKLRG